MDDVLAVLPDAIRATDPIYAPEWATSAPIERQVLASLSALAESNAGRPITRDALYAHLIRASDTVLDETSLIVSLRRLEYQDVIRAYPDRGYVFTVALQQQWLLIYGYLPPPAASISNTTPVAGPPNAPIGSTAAPRRAGVPIVGLIGALALIAALVLIVLASRSMAAGGSGAIGGTGTVSGAAEASTVTLDVNLQGTRHCRLSRRLVQRRSPLPMSSPRTWY